MGLSVSRYRAAAAVAAFLLAQGIGARELPVELRPAAAGTDCSVSGVLLQGPSGDVHTVTFDSPLRIGTVATVTIPLDGTSTLSAVSDGCWSEQITADANDERAIVRMWPAATALGGISVDRAMPQPTGLSASCLIAEEGEKTVTLRERPVTCSLEAKRWQCRVPAGALVHLKVWASNFAPLYFWDLRPVPGATIDLGIQALIPGASMVGRVMSEDEEPIANAEVRLSSATEDSQSPIERNLRSLSTRTGKSGFFQFKGLEPGVYRVTSKTAGRADATLDWIEVEAGRDLQLRNSLIHHPFSEIQVVLQPPASAGQHPWSVRLYRPGTRISEVVHAGDGEASVQGLWTKKGLPPGPYWLIVADEHGSEVAEESLQLRGGPERFVVNVLAITTHGRLRSGGKGVKAKIAFQLQRKQIVAESDEEGFFTAQFPTAGEWRPMVRLESGSSELRLPAVKIDAAQQDDLELEIAGGAVKGQVLDEHGNGAVALVRVLRGGRQTAADRAGNDGRFELTGLENGNYEIVAETEETDDGPLPFVITDEETAEVILHLEHRKEIIGVITTAAGLFASGAVVRVADPRTGSYEDTIADARGTYALQIAAKAEAIDVIVLAPPYPVAVRRVSANRKSNTANIQLAAQGSKLRIYSLRTPPWPSLIGGDGVPRSLGLLLMPLFGGPQRREFVNGGFQFVLEPGQYVVCNGSEQCQNVHLAANAEAIVDFTRRSEAIPPQ